MEYTKKCLVAALEQLKATNENMENFNIEMKKSLESIPRLKKFTIISTTGAVETTTRKQRKEIENIHLQPAERKRRIALLQLLGGNIQLANTNTTVEQCCENAMDNERIDQHETCDLQKGKESLEEKYKRLLFEKRKLENEIAKEENNKQRKKLKRNEDKKIKEIDDQEIENATKQLRHMIQKTAQILAPTKEIANRIYTILDTSKDLDHLPSATEIIKTYGKDHVTQLTIKELSHLGLLKPI